MLRYVINESEGRQAFCRYIIRAVCINLHRWSNDRLALRLLIPAVR